MVPEGGENNSRKDRSSKEQSKTGKQEQLPASYLVLPYIQGVTERLKRVYTKHNVSLYSKPGFTLRNALVRPKDPLAPGEKCGVIYKIKCEECGEVYVGETERSLGERTSEHQKSLHQKDCKSALSQHQLQAGHNITTRPISDIIEIIDQESRNPHRKIKEAVHIQLEGAKLNRTEGWELPKTYLPLLRREAAGGVCHGVHIIGHNTLVPYLNTVNGNRLLNTLCKKQSRSFYIRKREASVDEEQPGPHEPADLPGQGPGINDQNGDDIVIIDDEPAYAVEFGTLESSTFPLDMLEGFAGPHAAALLTAAAGVKRPWPVPLSLAAARDICRRQQRTPVILFGMTDTVAGTSLDRYTRDDRFLNLVSQTAAGTGSPALLIHLLPGSEEGREFMRRYGIKEGEMPALVAIADWNQSPVIIKSRDNREMQEHIDLVAAMDEHAAQNKVGTGKYNNTRAVQVKDEIDLERERDDLRSALQRVQAELAEARDKIADLHAELDGVITGTWQIAPRRPSSLGLCGIYTVSNINLKTDASSRSTDNNNTSDTGLSVLMATLTLLLAGDIHTNPGPIDLNLARKGLHESNVEDALACFMHLFTDILDKHAPVRKSSVRASPSQWVDDDLRELMNQRDEAKRIALASKTTDDYKVYTRLRNVVVLERLTRGDDPDIDKAVAPIKEQIMSQKDCSFSFQEVTVKQVEEQLKSLPPGSATGALIQMADYWLEEIDKGSLDSRKSSDVHIITNGDSLINKQTAYIPKPTWAPTLSDTLTALEKLSEEEPTPNTVLFHVGTNDVMSKPKEAVINDFKTVISTTQSLFPSAEVVISAVPPRRDTNQRPNVKEDIISINRHLKNTCDANTALTFVDHPQLWLDRDYNAKMFARDGYHLSKRLHGAPACTAKVSSNVARQNVVSRLEKDYQYLFRVAAENQYGIGPFIETDGPVTASDPIDMPEHLDITRVTRKTVELVWKRPKYDGGSPITGYIVESRNLRVNISKLNQNIVDRNIVTGLIENDKYEFKVAAQNKVGTGKYNNTRAVQVKGEIALGRSKSNFLVLWTVESRTVIIVELTVPWEENIQTAFERKKGKYQDLVMDCVSSCWKFRQTRMSCTMEQHKADLLKLEEYMCSLPSCLSLHAVEHRWTVLRFKITGRSAHKDTTEAATRQGVHFRTAAQLLHISSIRIVQEKSFMAKHIWRYRHPRVGVYEYTGIYLGDQPHGNSKDPESVYVLCRAAARDVFPEHRVCSLKDQLPLEEQPSNINQVKTKKYREARKRRGAVPSGGQNVADRVQQLEAPDGHPFARQVIRGYNKETAFILYTDEQIQDLKRFCCSSAHAENTVLGVDKTFTLGQFPVTILNFKHLGVVKRDMGEHPTFFGPMYVHGKSKIADYGTFCDHIRSKLDEPPSLPVVESDNERGLREAIARAWPGCHQLYCHRHIRNNFADHLQKKNCGQLWTNHSVGAMQRLRVAYYDVLKMLMSQPWSTIVPVKYADDLTNTELLMGSLLEQSQRALDSVVAWGEDFSLSANSKKTKDRVISSRRRENAPNPPQLTVDGH
ncbi:Titin-like [Branchiostoma belcheri]|nr:Titin-like [Branchiostoma belcheri]